MEFRAIRARRGPNVWSSEPVLEIVAVCESAEQADALARLGLDLQRRAGSPVAFAVSRPTGVAGEFLLAIEFEEESLGRAAVEAVTRSLGVEFDLDAEAALLKAIAGDVRLGPSTRSIVDAARARGIPATRLGEGSLVMLGQGSKQRRIWTAETDRTAALAEAIARDKNLTKVLLGSVGVPIPEGRAVEDADDAWREAQSIAGPVVVKPLDGNHGRGVATNLTTREQVVAAFEAAKVEGTRVIVERFIAGDDYRLLVVGDRLVAAARRQPAQVVGDGLATIRQLVDRVNRDPRRGEGHASVLTRIELADPNALAVLAEQGHSVDSVPGAGEKVLIRRNANLSTGGTAEDVTDLVHPDVAARAVEAARVVGLDIAGVDLVAQAIDRPLRETGAAVVEVNAGPGLRMHLEPSTGPSRPVGRAIVDMLFPGDASGRIPIAAVMGQPGRSVVGRMIEARLAAKGHKVARASAKGIHFGGRRIVHGDGSGWAGARAILLNPAVDAAVLHVSREGIVDDGLGFDRSDLVVLVGHEEQDGVDAERALVRTLGPTGTLVVGASHRRWLGLAEANPTVILFAIDESDERLVEHRERGGRAVFARDGRIFLAEGARLTPSIEAGENDSLKVEIRLACVASVWALGLELRG